MNRPAPHVHGKEGVDASSPSASTMRGFNSQGGCVAITGVHVLLHTPEAEAVRAVFRDVFGWSYVDAHEGWLIFALPPAELAVHPSSGTEHEVTFMCDDIHKTVEELKTKGIEFTG